MKRPTTLLMVSAFAFAFAGPAAAQDYPPEVFGEVSVSDSTVVCGAESVTVTGEGWVPGEEVRILFDGSQVGSATPGSDGAFEVTVDIPGAELGDHELQAIQDTEAEGRIEGSASVTCVEAATLAATGANISVWLAIVAGLLVAGGAALFAGRRRKVEPE